LQRSGDHNVDGLGADGITGEYDTLQYLTRVLSHQLAVFEGFGLAFVGVATEVARALVIFGKNAPLDAGWKSDSATAL